LPPMCRCAECDKFIAASDDYLCEDCRVQVDR
jgi:hypothetical protein